MSNLPTYLVYKIKKERKGIVKMYSPYTTTHKLKQKQKAI